jgi:hypothetical protein
MVTMASARVGAHSTIDLRTNARDAIDVTDACSPTKRAATLWRFARPFTSQLRDIYGSAHLRRQRRRVKGNGVIYAI